MKLVLSLFPGLDLLGKGFAAELGACVVHGPDLIWGWDVRGWHAPAGVFWGVIGGPPCKVFSRLARLTRARGIEPKHPNLIPEFERLVGEAAPEWFLMENVPEAPVPSVLGYVVRDVLLDNRWLGEEQRRKRRFSFGTRDGRALDLSPEIVVMENAVLEPSVIGHGGGAGLRRDKGYLRRKATYEATKAAARRPVGRLLELQGERPEMLDWSPLTSDGKRDIVGNAVPLPMACALARAVGRAMGGTSGSGAGPGREGVAY